MDWYFWVALWFIGVLISFGVHGEPRDEMDGLIDLFKIFCWPIYVVLLVVLFIAGIFVNIGLAIRKRSN